MKAEKIKRNFWLSTEIECMLRLIKEVQQQQGSTATTHYTFVQIANKMKKRGFPNKSPTQIRRKWFQMKSAYLCFKRGNVERLLLIPEKFRSVIADFVESENKHGKLLSTKAQENYNNITKSEPEETQSSSDSLTYETEKPTREEPSEDPGANETSPTRLVFTNLIQQLRQNYTILSNDFKNMQEALMQYEHDCQALRDANWITFLENC